MAGLISKYTKLISNLLPQGWAWDQVRKHPFIEGIAGEFCRVDDRARALLREIDIQQADELIDDFRSAYGIPDECTPEVQTLQEKRDQVIQRMTTVGSLSAQFYEDLGQTLGFDVKVSNYLAFQVGRSTVGQGLTNYEPPRNIFTVGMTVGTQLQTPGWLFYFNVDLPASAVDFFEVGQNTVGDPLVDFSNLLLECTYNRLKPAHGAIFFTFS